MDNKIILEYRVGSHLYGTNTPESDEDYAEIQNLCISILKKEFN